jgi:hypothetical protein
VLYIIKFWDSGFLTWAYGGSEVGPFSLVFLCPLSCIYISAFIHCYVCLGRCLDVRLYIRFIWLWEVVACWHGTCYARIIHYMFCRFFRYHFLYLWYCFLYHVFVNHFNMLRLRHQFMVQFFVLSPHGMFVTC